MRFRSLTASALVLAGILAAVPVSACFEVDSPPTATIRFLTPTSAEVIVTGLVVQPGGLLGGEYCAAGLGFAGVLGSVTALSIVDAADDPPTPFAEYAFLPDPTTTGDMAALVPTTPVWYGFSTQVSGPRAAGDPADLAFTIAISGGTTYDDIQTELAANGLIVVDDATAGGNLTNGPNQSVEAISAFVELPDCYNDVIDGNEVCDAYANLGCAPGDVCAQCNACVAPNYPNQCKGKSLKSIGAADKARLKCYARGAKLNQVPDPNCLAATSTLITFYWQKLGASLAACPLFPSFASSTAVDGLINTFEGNLAGMLPYGATLGPAKCSNAKFKAASLRSANSLKCYIKAYFHNTTVDPVCLSKVDLKFNQAFTRAENPGLCDPGNVGNAGAVAALVDQFVGDVLNAIPPP